MGSIIVTSTIASILLGPPCLAMECPMPQPAGAPDAIQETPAQISDLTNLLGSGDLGNRIPIIVRDLRSRHPNAPGGEVVNYLVTAYCPVVNRLDGLSDNEKQARIEAFTSQVVQAAY
jgi:hypothetical protein